MHGNIGECVWMNFRQPRTFPMVPYSMPCGAAALTPQPSSARRPSLRRIRYRSGDIVAYAWFAYHRRGGDDGERHAAPAKSAISSSKLFCTIPPSLHGWQKCRRCPLRSR